MPLKENPDAPGEIVVSRVGGNTPALWSLPQETPATSPQVFYLWEASFRDDAGLRYG